MLHHTVLCLWRPVLFGDIVLYLRFFVVVFTPEIVLYFLSIVSIVFFSWHTNLQPPVLMIVFKGWFLCAWTVGFLSCLTVFSGNGYLCVCGQCSISLELQCYFCPVLQCSQCKEYLFVCGKCNISFESKCYFCPMVQCSQCKECLFMCGQCNISLELQCCFCPELQCSQCKEYLFVCGKCNISFESKCYFCPMVQCSQCKEYLFVCGQCNISFESKCMGESTSIFIRRFVKLKCAYMEICVFRQFPE